MSSRKISAIRQLSLNCESPTADQRRKTLKKQLSEDIPDVKDKWLDKDLGIRISLSAKLRSKEQDKPPPIKLAWGEDDQKDLFKKEKQESILVTKCIEQTRRPSTTTKLTKQSSLEKDSILYSRQELAERLRLAWKERDQRKQNLDIFLAHNTKEDEYNDTVDTESSLMNEKVKNEPKIILPLKPDLLDDNYKNVFQKRLRRFNRSSTSFTETCYSPTRIKENVIKPENKSSTIVVVPIVENETNPTVQQPILTKEVTPPTTPKDVVSVPSSPVENPLENAKPINNVVIRRITSAQKRESFQKRTNSAFHGSITNGTFKPPLVRASSVPSKPEQTKPKFLATKRRTKTTKRKDAKNEGSNEVSEDEELKNKKCNRTVTNNGTDIVTMVSLTSPAGSDTEEPPSQVENVTTKPKNNSPVKIKDDKIEKNFSLRKTVKSVSFQQSTIHAVRSFSASFPARRASIATPLLLSNSSIFKSNQQKDGQKMQEKRTTAFGLHDDEERVPKRRLLRTKSITLQNSFEDTNEQAIQKLQRSKTVDETDISEEKQQEINNKLSCLPNDDANNTDDEVKDEENEDTRPKFGTPKEKQCWDLYCKMSEKGVSVSFDTILRGMLTPTEYRMRRKSLVQTEEL